ncbi:hypothetical protein MZM54_00110 [[Brevibacterium] frigoritolerans]|nr:hypothetical protein [Peribacillus frigoritolerans]
MTSDNLEFINIEIDPDESYVMNVIVKCLEGKWYAECKWSAGNFETANNAIEGIIATSYFAHTLEEAIDLIIKRKEQFQIKDHPLGIYLMYIGDGEDEDFPPPNNLLELLKVEARKRGWETYKKI